jgi:hypothetical protein
MSQPITMMSTTKEINEYAKEKVVTRFNSLLGEFMRKLIATFPDDAIELKACYTKILIPVAIDKTSVIVIFECSIKPYSALIEQKSDDFFTSDTSPLEMFDNIDMKRNWKASSPATKNAIWSYIQSLSTLASTYHNFGNALDSVPDLGKQMLNDFKEKYNRAPTADDDISEFSAKIAKELGLELDCLSTINMRQIEKKLRQIDVGAIVGVKLNKVTKNKLVMFVMKQFRHLQRRQRNSRIGGEKENVDSLK